MRVLPPEPDGRTEVTMRTEPPMTTGFAMEHGVTATGSRRSRCRFRAQIWANLYFDTSVNRQYFVLPVRLVIDSFPASPTPSPVRGHASRAE